MSAPREQRDPFFVYYDARSRSTLLANQLVKRYAVAIPPESNFVVALLESHPRTEIGDERELDRALARMASERKFTDLGVDVQRLRARWIEQLPCTTADVVRSILAIHRDACFPGAKRCGIKKGSYLFHHGELQRMFPGAHFLGLVRDGRAVFNSKKKSLYSVTGKPFETDPVRAARTWVEHVRLLRRIEGESERARIVRYEAVVQDPERVLAEVAAFLGLRAAQRAAHESPRYAVTARYDRELHAHVDGPPLRERLDAWRRELAPSHVRAYEAVAGPELEREGYDLLFGT